MKLFVLFPAWFVFCTVFNLVHLVRITHCIFFVTDTTFAVDFDEPFRLIKLVLETCIQIDSGLQEWHDVIFATEPVMDDCSLLSLSNFISWLQPNSLCYVIDTLRCAARVFSALFGTEDVVSRSDLQTVLFCDSASSIVDIILKFTAPPNLNINSYSK